jgi:4-hydroxyphenylpyruvate dioxygenase
MVGELWRSPDLSMKTSIATVSLSGDLTAKLQAIAAVGYDGFELFEADLTSSSLQPEAVRLLSEQLGLSLFALQPFRDFEGMLDAARGAAMTRAERKFDLMTRLGTDLMLIPSNCSPHATDGVTRAAADLRELGDRAAQRGFRIGYEALAWGRYVRDWTTAWEIVQRADHPNVGLVLDTYHLFVRGNPLSPIRDVPVNKLFIVQLADAPSLDMEVLRHSRHLRNFPGQGDYPITDFLAELLAIGYDGVLSHEIFNDEFRSAPQDQTARDGYRSLVWLEEEMVRRSAATRIALPRLPEPTHWTDAPRPMPTAQLTEFSFLEFAAADETKRCSLMSFLERIGFRRTHRHRSKAVDLFGCGGAWIAVNAEPSTYTAELVSGRNTVVSGFGVVTSDAAASLARANAYKCEEVARDRQPGEMNLPAIRGVGGTLVYLVDAQAPHFTATDFEAVQAVGPGGPAAPDVLVVTIDHIAQAVAADELLSALLFYRTVLGLDLQPSLEFADLNGLVTSRTVVSANGGIRIPLNTATSGATSPERFRSTAQGSGVQHIAFAANDFDAMLAIIDPQLVLPIPANYYDDLVARFDLDEVTLDHLKRHNLLYDRNDDGEYLHLYTQEMNGVFFEFVQRVRYRGFGAPNAPIRLAAQAHNQASQ